MSQVQWETTEKFMWWDLPPGLWTGPETELGWQMTHSYLNLALVENIIKELLVLPNSSLLHIPPEAGHQSAFLLQLERPKDWQVKGEQGV